MSEADDYKTAEILEALEKRGDIVEKQNPANFFEKEKNIEVDYNIEDIVTSFFKRFNENDSYECFKFGTTIGNSSNARSSKDFLLEVQLCVEHMIKKHLRETNSKKITKELQTIFIMSRNCIELLEDLTNSKETKLEQEKVLATLLGFFISKYNKLVTSKE